MPSLLIRNARIARSDGTIIEGCLLCERGVIQRIDSYITPKADEIIDAEGKLLLPGVIDPHVHFREPGMEYKEDLATGSHAAAKGGVTSFIEMPNTTPPTIDQATLDDKLNRAAKKCIVNYGFFIGATTDNLDAINKVHPVAGIKVFMGCSTGGLLIYKDEDLERIFAFGDRLIAVHAEDEERLRERVKRYVGHTDAAIHSEVRDDECARRATARALALSKKYRRRLHILHLSTQAEVELLKHDKPTWVRAEVIPNHLLLNTTDYTAQGARVQMNPPIRRPETNEALWGALRDGIIDFMGTDHAPHALEEKDQGYPKAPSGMPGIETALPLMLTQMHAGRCTLAQIQKWMCYGPAQAYGITNKGRIELGYDADLTLVDLETSRSVRNEELFTKSKWSPYAGLNLIGWPLYTIVGGNIVFDRGRIRDNARGTPLRFGIPGQ